MERRITAEITIEQIVNQFPELIRPLFERGIRCLS